MDKLEEKLDALTGRKRIHCGSLSAALLTVSAVALSSCGIFLPWWDGPSSSEFLLGEGDDFTASFTLWDVRAVDGEASTATWDDVCRDRVPAADTCIKLKLTRWFAVASVALGVITLIVTLFALTLGRLKPRLRWFRRSASLSLLTAMLAGTALLLAARLCTRDLLGTGVLTFSVALPCYVAASFTAVYQATVTPLDSASANGGRRGACVLSHIEQTNDATRRFKVRLDTGPIPTYAQLGTDLKAQSRRQPLDVLDRLVLWICRCARHGSIPVSVLEEVFAEIDKNSDGVIEEHELAESLQKAGLAEASEPIDRVMRQMDLYSIGDIDKDQFIEFFRVVQEVNADHVVWRRRREADYFVCAFCFLFHFVLLGCLLMGSHWMLSEEPKPDAMHKILDTIRFLFVLLSALFAIVVLISMARLALWLRQTVHPRLQAQQGCPEQDDKVHVLEDHLWACEGPRAAAQGSAGSSPKLPVTRVTSHDSLPGFIPDSEEDETGKA